MTNNVTQPVQNLLTAFRTLNEHVDQNINPDQCFKAVEEAIEICKNSRLKTEEIKEINNVINVFSSSSKSPSEKLQKITEKIQNLTKPHIKISLNSVSDQLPSASKSDASIFSTLSEPMNGKQSTNSEINELKLITNELKQLREEIIKLRKSKNELIKEQSELPRVSLFRSRRRKKSIKKKVTQIDLKIEKITTNLESYRNKLETKLKESKRELEELKKQRSAQSKIKSIPWASLNCEIHSPITDFEKDYVGRVYNATESRMGDPSYLKAYKTESNDTVNLSTQFYGETGDIGRASYYINGEPVSLRESGKTLEDRLKLIIDGLEKNKVSFKENAQALLYACQTIGVDSTVKAWKGLDPMKNQGAVAEEPYYNIVTKDGKIIGVEQILKFNILSSNTKAEKEFTGAKLVVNRLAFDVDSKGNIDFTNGDGSISLTEVSKDFKVSIEP